MGRQNLKSASKKAIHESKVQQAGMLGTDMGEFEAEDFMSPVEQAVGSFIERVHENINNEKNMVTTGSINDITIEAKNGAINVMANPHLVYQDRGVNGSKKQLYDTPHKYTDKKPPVQVFVDWIKEKGLTLTDKNDYHRKMDDRLSEKERSEDRPFKELTDEEKILSAAYGMREKVFQEGFKPRKIYSKEIPQLTEDLAEILGDFALQQINQQITLEPREGGESRIIVKL